MRGQLGVMGCGFSRQVRRGRAEGGGLVRVRMGYKGLVVVDLIGQAEQGRSGHLLRGGQWMAVRTGSSP